MSTASIRLMSIPDIMALASESVDIPNRNGEVDWWGILRHKVSAGHFDALVDEIQANGFGMPIVLCDRYRNGRYALGNGHHRLCAAILLGLWRIPVILSEGAARDDFMRPEDSMDDYGRPVEGWSHDYWMMLGENMGDSDGTVDIPESEHPEFYCDYCNTHLRVSVECCATDHLALHHPECEDCGNRDCGSDHECYECGAHAVQAEDHRLMCFERGWEIVDCYEGCGNAWGNSVYRKECPHIVQADERDAYDMAALRLALGLDVPQGVWHPVNVLNDAYGQHEEWLRDAPLREARAAYVRAVVRVRDSVNANARTWEIINDAQHIVEQWNNYCAL